MRLKPIFATALSFLFLSSFACKKDEPNPEVPSFDVTVNPLTIDAGGEFTVNITVKNFELDPANYGMMAMPGKGHWHVYLDTETMENKLKGSALPTETIPMPIAATAGPHKLLFLLENNDHTPVAGAESKSIDITVKTAPPPTLQAQVNPTTIPAGGNFTVTVQVTNFELDQANYGGMPIPGHGHYHVYIDQIGDANKLKGSAQTPQMITLPVETTPGAHTLLFHLETNNHMMVPNVEVRVPITVEAAPPVTMNVVLDNTTIEAGGYATATVDVKYFVLDEDAVGKPNVDRHGHWHAYLDQVAEPYLAASPLAMDRVTIPATTTEGPHNLIFKLYNNDHTPYTPSVEQTIPITVAVVAPPPPNNVVVEGNTTKLGAYLAGTTEYAGNASLLVYGVSQLLTTMSDANGVYSLQVPENGNALIFSNKPNYFPSYNVVTTQTENIVGEKLYMAEVDWINAIAANHNVDLTAPFDCHAPALDPNIKCIYTIIVGRIHDDGYDGQGQIRPVAGIRAIDFTIRGPGAQGEQWYKKGPYFLNYDGTPGVYPTSVNYLDAATQTYRGGLFVTFLEIPQLDGAPYLDFQVSISYDDAARGTRYFGPLDVKAFRPYGVSWVTINETGVPIQQPLTNINFDTQIYPLFLPVAQGGLGCIGCHTNGGGATPAGGMNLYGGPEVAYNSLKDPGYPNRVNLQDIDASYVLKRPLYEADGNQDHPIFAFASTQDLGYLTIRKWIEEGAIRNVVVQPVSFYNDIRTLLYQATTTCVDSPNGYAPDSNNNGTLEICGAGCRTCHTDIPNPNLAPGGFYMSTVAAELYDSLVNQPATHSDYPDAADPQHEPYRINKQNYPERSLALIKPLFGNAALHPVKIFANNADPRYQLVYRWIVEGYQNDSP